MDREPSDTSEEPISDSEFPLIMEFQSNHRDLRVEFVRCNLTGSILGKLMCFPKHKKMTAIDNFSFWLLTNASDVRDNDEDVVFSRRKIGINYYPTLKYKSIMRCRNIYISSIIQELHTYIYQFLSWLRKDLPGYTPNNLTKNANNLNIRIFPTPKKISWNSYSEVEENSDLEEITIAVNNQEFSISKLLRDRLYDNYLQYGLTNNLTTSLEDFYERISTMILRYRSMMMRGNQFAIPPELAAYMIHHFHVLIEGFASPINSNFTMHELPYCSLFPDTDKYFGSLGSFYNQDFTNKGVFCNPPYTEIDINLTCDKIFQDCHRIERKNMEEPDPTKKEWIFYILNIPIWQDMESIHRLMDSPYLIKTYYLDPGKFYHVDNVRASKVPIRSSKLLLFIGVNINFTDKDWQNFEQHLDNYQIENNRPCKTIRWNDNDYSRYYPWTGSSTNLLTDSYIPIDSLIIHPENDESTVSPVIEISEGDLDSIGEIDSIDFINSDDIDDEPGELPL